MTTYEGGVRVISLLRWPGMIKPGQVLTGIQAHMDMFTTFAAAAGVPDVVEQMKTEKKQLLDGVNNLDYWTGKTQDSKRHNFLYYYESKMAAVRVGPWKLHFLTREDYYDVLTARTAPLFMNIRSDPFESFDSKTRTDPGAKSPGSRADYGPRTHLKTLAEYPPVQGGSSFDMSNMVQEFLKHARQ